ncbi:hypothetical protein [Archangium sp.]|uniref:hypothetical protein n=1 Tax=Archangium sp. TaxID=1872627 RepID=UPI002869FD2A|nr:hypothetical protein [Archangium sp.]
MVSMAARQDSRSEDAPTADPLGTRGTVTANARYTLWSVEVPIPGNPRLMQGSAIGGSMSTDLYGRRLGFDLGYRVLSTNAVNADGRALSEDSSYTAIELQSDFNYVLFNSTPVFLSAGIGANARINVMNLDEPFARSLGSWTTIAAGPNVRARFFLGPNFYVTGSAFVGFVKVAGLWTAAGINASTVPPQAFYEKGGLEGLFVINGAASLAWRPFEWFALSAGFGYRKSSFQVVTEADASGNTRELGAANENDLQPFAGVEFLY